MNLKHLITNTAAFMLVLMTTAQAQNSSQLKMTIDNPFARPSTLLYQTADFSKIKDADFEPAFLEGINQQMEEVKAIANNSVAPTFDNTLIALEKSGQLLHRINGVFNLLSGANTNDNLQKLSETIAPRLSEANDAIFLNTPLFKRVEALYNQRNTLKLDPESLRLLDYYYQKFILSGARLDEKQKEALKKMNSTEAGLEAKFTNKLLASAKSAALIIDDKTELAGMSESDMEAAATLAKNSNHPGKWMISMRNTTQQPLLSTLTNRETRRKLFEASWNRAERNDSSDTREIILQLANLRAEKAKLIGFENFASLTLMDQMAKKPEAVMNFINRLVPAATAKAMKEAEDIQHLIDAQKGGFKLEPWDWDFYAEQVRKAKFDLDEAQVKPYFELNTVLEKGVFFAAEQLYGLSFKERKDLPVYNPDVRVFEVFDKDGKSMALYYCDYYKRDNKNGGAWMDNIVGQSKLLGTRPVIYNICNFNKPAAGQPALISFDDVTTMFHEFGHGLHGLFANQQYLSLSGTATARDFVEFPSQFNEHWASYPDIFKHYARHYKTGEVMPAELVTKIKNAATFNQGYRLTELLAAATLDMQWHSITTAQRVTDVDAFEETALKINHLDLKQVPTRYRSSYFLHIWSNGYASGYYAYLWTEMLDDDAYEWFKENGGLTRQNGQRFRDMILSKGNTVDLSTLYKQFRGSEPNIHPMLENRGLVGETR